MASVLISRNYSKAEKERTKKAPFLGLVAFPPGFEPGAFRLGGVVRPFCTIMQNVRKSEKSLYYGVF